jgi:hypothetical protein
VEQALGVMREKRAASWINGARPSGAVTGWPRRGTRPTTEEGTMSTQTTERPVVHPAWCDRDRCTVATNPEYGEHRRLFPQVGPDWIAHATISVTLILPSGENDAADDLPPIACVCVHDHDEERELATGLSMQQVHATAELLKQVLAAAEHG